MNSSGLILALTGLLSASSPGWGQMEANLKNEIIVFGKDVLLKEDEMVRQIVVMWGSVTIKGTVQKDVVVISGNASVEGAIKGDLVVIGGGAKLGPEAEVRHNLVVIGGQVRSEPGARFGHQRVILSPEQSGFRWIWNWLAQGLFWGRPMPPQFLWVWSVAGLFLFCYVLLALLFPRPVQACVHSLEERPLSSFFVGLLVFISFGPLLLLLALSVVGIVLIPCFICAVFAAFVFGKAAVYRYTGQQLGAQVGMKALQEPLLALVIGVLLFYLLYMVPFLGFLIWGVILPLACGAAVLAFFGSFRTAASSTAFVPNARPSTPTVVEPTSPPSSPPLPPAPPLILARVGFWRRLIATVLDFLLVVIFLRLFRHHFPFFLLFWGAYHVGFWAWRGTTIGGMVLGIKLVRLDGGPIDFGVALVRALASVFSAVPLFLGFFWAGWDPEKQSWHDKVAGTYAVRGSAVRI